jgi:rubredoxin
LVRYSHGYYWICPKCKSSYDVGRYFVDKKMKCVCGNIYVIKKGDGTVVMRDGDAEAPVNAKSQLQERNI